MNWIQIVRLIIVLWPLVERILEGEQDETRKQAKSNAVTNAMAATLTQPTPPSDPLEVIVPIANALNS